MNYVKLIAPAKVNLILAVGEKRPDGYHDAHTILHALSLHDTLQIRKTDLEGSGNGLTINVKCEVLGGVEELAIPTEENITYRAALLLAEATGRTADEHLDIQISKQIPHEAGLGGGSSDAAATLKGLAALWNLTEDDPRLLETAAKLGADVPFFLFGGCAYLDGRGDHFVHALTPRKDFLALVRPTGSGVSTGEAYRLFDEDPTIPSPEFLKQIAAYENAAEVEPFNNLTTPALAIKPELADIFGAIEAMPEADQTLLCGSGSAIAVLTSSYENACAVSLAMNKAGHYARVTSFAPLGASLLQ